MIPQNRKRSLSEIASALIRTIRHDLADFAWIHIRADHRVDGRICKRHGAGEIRIRRCLVVLLNHLENRDPETAAELAHERVEPGRVPYRGARDAAERCGGERYEEKADGEAAQRTRPKDIPACRALYAITARDPDVQAERRAKYTLLRSELAAYSARLRDDGRTIGEPRGMATLVINTIETSLRRFANDRITLDAQERDGMLEAIERGVFSA